MSGGHRDESIFVRRRRTPRYVYNPRNPIGRALIVISAVVAVGYMYYLFDSSSWSESEWRDAVHEAARELESEPQPLSGGSRYEYRIEDAVKATGEGPEYALVRVDAIQESDTAGRGGAGADRGSDAFEISTDDVETIYCMRVSPPLPKASMSTTTVTLHVDVKEGPC
ncbi:hypothetical protein [Streptomyces sp. NPDC005408]|uniref:hypothetical protein n=1 Tax=Streptomyces sp. NPDC005408 TaxID=3155341 RepID=UPI0033A2F147